MLVAAQVGGMMKMLHNGVQFEDGHKYLCGLDAMQAPCTVLSIGRRVACRAMYCDTRKISCHCHGHA
jgi:hypothetical protein